MRVWLAAAAAASLATTAAAEGWTTYHNERFGVTIERPAAWTAEPPPENGDGLVFDSPDGRAHIVASGIRSLGEVAEDVDTRLRPNPGETITYKTRGRNFVVVSGIRGDVIFYRKSLLSCGGALWNDLSIEYPASKKSAYDALVARVARSLRAGPGYEFNDCKD